MKKVKQTILLVFTLGLIAVIVSGTVGAYQNIKQRKSATPQAVTKQNVTPITATDNAPTVAASGKYAQPFDHFARVTEGKPREAHDQLTQAQNCESCHSRTDNNPQTPLPYHDSCVRCHTNQFTDTRLEICADCHSKPYTAKPAVNSMRKLTQFGMEFSHASHKVRDNFKCETCHYTPSDGKTMRSTYPAHKECFECHTFNNSKAKGNCNECHNNKATAEKFRERGRINIAYNLFKFNHGKHLAYGKRCDQCHSVVNTDATTKTDISRINIVFSKDATKVHNSLCFSCHQRNPPEQPCAKCHVKPEGTLSLPDIK